MRSTGIRFALAGVLAGGLIAMAVPSMAGPGDPLLMGSRNFSYLSTEIVGKVPGQPNLIVRNTADDGTALQLKVVKGNPPLEVSSNVIVKRLNADRVDGWHANHLSRAAFAATDNVDEAIFVDDGEGNATGDLLSVSISAPRSGILLITGSAESHLSGVTTSLYVCDLTVDGADVPGTKRYVQLTDNGGEENDEPNCATNGGFVVADGGEHTVALRVVGRQEPVLFEGATLQVQYIAFDGDGSRP
jgi:hypothetical protein